MAELQDAVIVSGVRTAIGTYGGGLAEVPAVKLGEICIRAALERADLKPHQVQEVIMGNVLQAGLGQNPARQSAVNAGLPVGIPALTINKVCGSGHIAGIINPPSKSKDYWTNEKQAANADQWFEGAQSYKGSWWTDWSEWLKLRSGQQREPSSMGSKNYPPITAAPGMYVLEK